MNTVAVTIRSATPDDAACLAEIYNHYVLNTSISFETEAVSAADMAQRISATLQADLPWLVLEAGGVLVGYAYASKWRVRHAYRYSVETSVYLSPSAAGKGYGEKLYRVLLDDVTRRGMHLAIGGIAQPNPASVALHEKLGFKKVAHFSEVGMKFGVWRDVAYWQRILASEPE